MEKENSINIDLSNHPSPNNFVNRMCNNYPDENVIIILKENQMEVTIDSKVPTQLQINIISLLTQKAKEEIYAPTI